MDIFYGVDEKYEEILKSLSKDERRVNNIKKQVCVCVFHLNTYAKIHLVEVFKKQ